MRRGPVSARRAPAAGRARFAIQVGGLTVGVESAVPEELSLAVAAGMEPFLAPPAWPRLDLDLRAEWRPLAAEPAGRLVFDSGGAWRLHEQDGRDVYRFFDSRLGPAPYKEARLEAREARGALYLDPAAHDPNEAVDALQFPLDELLFLRLLAAGDGLELHACGVVAPSGRGYLFAGHSGDGKSTTARLWAETRGAKVLSDDRIVLRREGGAWSMYGTPWHGEAAFASNEGAPLAAILILARGDGPALVPLRPAKAVSGLLARSFVLLHDAAALSATIERLEALAREVPCLRFPFRPGPEAVRFVLEAL